MKKKVEEIRRVTWEYFMVGSSAKKTLVLAKDYKFAYSKIIFNGYTIEFNGNVIDFGCKRITLDILTDIKCFLTEEGDKFETYAVNKNGVKLFKKDDIVDESDNYYITTAISGNRAYNKDDISEFKEFKIENKSLEIQDLNNSWRRKGLWYHYLGHALMPVSDKDELIKIVDYLSGMFDAYNEAFKDFEENEKK